MEVTQLLEQSQDPPSKEIGIGGEIVTQTSDQFRQFHGNERTCGTIAGHTF